MEEIVPGVVWFFVAFALGIGASSFFKRSKESVEEVSGEGLLFDKIAEKEKETEDFCKRLKEENAGECEQNLKKAKEDAEEIIRKAKEEIEQIEKTSKASIRNAFRDSALVLKHLLNEKTKDLIAGENSAIKNALQTVSDEIIAAGKNITWKENSFELVSTEGNELAIKPEDISLLALSLLEPGIQKNLPLPEELATILEKQDESR